MAKIFTPFPLRDHPGFNPVFLDWFRKIEIALEKLTSNPMTEYTPTVVPFSGTITTLGAVSGRFQKIKDNLWFVQLGIPITTNGTGAGYIEASLPFTPVKDQVIQGRETSVIGVSLYGQLIAGVPALFIGKYDNSYPGGDGYTLNLSGVLEAEL